MAREVPIQSEMIKLDSFLKWEGIAPTGGQAKLMVAAGKVRVNGQVAYRRSLLLQVGDTVEVDGQAYRVTRAK